MIPSLMKRTRFSSSSSTFPQGTKPSLKDTTYVAKLSVSLEPERTKIIDPRNTYDNPAQTYYGHWSRETTCKTVLYLFRAVALVHAPTILNWVLPVAGPLYRVSKYGFSPLVILPAPIQKIPLSLLVAAAVPFYPILHPPPLPRFFPGAVWGQRVRVLVSQSGRPNEMHNGIVATRRAFLSRSKRRLPSVWPGLAHRVSRPRKAVPSPGGAQLLPNV